MTAQPDYLTFATGNQKLLGHLAMLSFSALVAASFSVGALAAPHIAPAAINAARFLFGTMIMAFAASMLLKGGISRPREPWRFAVIGVLMATFFITMFVSLRITTPVAAAAVFTLMPMMSAFFGWLFLGQVPRPIVVVSLLLAACGAVWLIFRGDLDALLAFDIGPGEAIFFVGCVCHAAYVPLVRKFSRGEPLLVFTLYSLAATGLAIALWGLRDIAATDWSALPPVVWVAIAYLAVFTTAGTTFLIQFASMRLPASKVLAYGYLNPCFVIVYEGLLGHGWVAPMVGLGALVTVLALIVMALAPDR